MDRGQGELVTAGVAGQHHLLDPGRAQVRLVVVVEQLGAGVDPRVHALDHERRQDGARVAVLVAAGGRGVGHDDRALGVAHAHLLEHLGARVVAAHEVDQAVAGVGRHGGRLLLDVGHDHHRRPLVAAGLGHLVDDQGHQAVPAQDQQVVDQLVAVHVVDLHAPPEAVHHQGRHHAGEHGERRQPAEHDRQDHGAAHGGARRVDHGLGRDQEEQRRPHAVLEPGQVLGVVARVGRGEPEPEPLHRADQVARAGRQGRG